jgi:hypothetical protein
MGVAALKEAGFGAFDHFHYLLQNRGVILHNFDLLLQEDFRMMAIRNRYFKLFPRLPKGVLERSFRRLRADNICTCLRGLKSIKGYLGTSLFEYLALITNGLVTLNLFFV